MVINVNLVDIYDHYNLYFFQFEGKFMFHHLRILSIIVKVLIGIEKKFDKWCRSILI